MPTGICHANDYEEQNRENTPDGIKTDIPIYQYPQIVMLINFGLKPLGEKLSLK